MKYITVHSRANGTHSILVDDCDYELVTQYNWFIYRCTFNGKKARTFYAVANKNGVSIRMHRLLLGLTDPKILVDHKDHNGLNNQKENIRIVSAQQNQFNMRPFKTNKTGLKGVSYNKKDKKYAVFLRVNKRNTFFGNFKTPIEAAKKWNELARQHHGEFAYQNPV